MITIDVPTAFRPATLWTFDQAVAAYERVAALCERVRKDEAGLWAEGLATAVEALIAAHMPERVAALSTPWIGGEGRDGGGVPEHAVCHGSRDDDGSGLWKGCWGDGWRDTQTPWPCPAMLPILVHLEVPRGR